MYLGETLLRQRKEGEADAAFRKAEELGRGAPGGDYYRGVERFLTLASSSPEADRAKAILRAAKR